MREVPRPKIATTSNGKLVVPTWVPDAVKKWALEEIEGSFRDKKQKETLLRLLTDRRMRHVWRELTRRKRGNYRTTDEFFHQTDRQAGPFCQKKKMLLPITIGIV